MLGVPVPAVCERHLLGWGRSLGQRWGTGATAAGSEAGAAFLLIQACPPMMSFLLILLIVFFPGVSLTAPNHLSLVPPAHPRCLQLSCVLQPLVC